ncbi:MAG: class I SAM-dependent methyltransferase [Burkholderiales bacterium]|nr:class I SAM-dependent methyltransferase [Burkholderiales bacterium]
MLRSLRDALFPVHAVSTGYVTLQKDQADVEGRRLRGAWWDETLPARQRSLVEQQLRQYRRGKPVEVFDVLVRALRSLPQAPGMSLLEIGCSSGFYSEVLAIAGLGLEYSGCDYSPPFVKMAMQTYPQLKFRVEDNVALSYADRSFDIVVSGCCLLHIPEYAIAVAETVRVARSWVIFHRTPVVFGQPERWYRKQAYGVDLVEIHFNEPDFLSLLDRHGLTVIATYTLHEERSSGSTAVGQAVRTYVCGRSQQ